MSTYVNRGIDWLLQAENDLLWAKDSLAREYYSQTCFIAQHIGEKALKALAYFRQLEPRGHSLKDLSILLEINGNILKVSKKLDFYYISSRYPDAFPSGSPFEFFSIEQATEAVSFAEMILEKVKDEMMDKKG